MVGVSGLGCSSAACAISNGVFLICAAECGVGQYIDGTGCTPCPKDQYSDEDNRSACKVCPIGSRTKGKGSSMMSDCEGIYFFFKSNF